MDSRPATSRVNEEGLASLQFVLAAALAMVLVVGLVQVIAYQFTRGAVMAALERSVRAGAVVGAAADECRASLKDSISQVLGGEVSSNLAASCGSDDEFVWATANGVVPSWLAWAPDLPFRLETRARREPAP